MREERTPDPPVVGVAEIAEMMGVPRGHVAVMRHRGEVPQPQVVLACGPIWKRSTIEHWIAERESQSLDERSKR